MAEPGVKKTTIRLPEPLWREARKRALDEGRDFQDLVETALSEYLRKPVRKAGAR